MLDVSRGGSRTLRQSQSLPAHNPPLDYSTAVHHVLGGVERLYAGGGRQDVAIDFRVPWESGYTVDCWLYQMQAAKA